MSLGLSFTQWRVGALPGPPLTNSYKPKFFQREFISYILRAMSGSGGWNKGEAELFAYKIIDEDVESLRTLGYSNEMIYEVTLVGAVGAALVGLEAVYKHLYG